MKKVISLIKMPFLSAFLLLLLPLLVAQPLRAQIPFTKSWDKTFGGSSDDYFTSMAQAADGGYLFGGYTNSEVGGDKSDAKGLLDFWVVKTNQDGVKQWDKTFGGSNNELLHALIATPDGGFLLGGMSNSEIGGDKSEASRGGYDFWVIKLNADGTKAWDMRYGGDSWDELRTLLVTPDGGYLLGGVTHSGAGGDKTEASRGDRDYWLVKLNADGSKAWDKTLGGIGYEILTATVATPDGGYLVGGHSPSSAGLGGDKTEHSRGGQDDYWVVKLNADGSKAWDKTLGGNGLDYLYAMIPASDGGYLLGGMSTSGAGHDKTEVSRGGSDYWVVKLNEDGTKAWDKTTGGNNYDDLYTLAATPDGGYLLGGASNSGAWGDKTEASKGESDFWFVKISSSGSRIWDKSFGGNSSDQLRTITRTADGGYLFGGWSISVAGNDKTEAPRGGADYWVMKMSAQALSSGSDKSAHPDFTVYPNPGKENLNIMLTGLTLKESAELVLVNVLGQPVFRQTVAADALQTGIMLPAASFPSGSYFLQLHLQGRSLTKKVVLVRE